MPIYEIPGQGTLQLSVLVLDLNGTVAVDGKVIPGVAERVEELRAQGIACYLLTADTRGNGAEIATALGMTLVRLKPDDERAHERAQKRAFVDEQGADQVVAVGNGANDAEMLRVAALGIAVLQEEGMALTAWSAADIVVPDICAALDLLLKPKRLVATIRF